MGRRAQAKASELTKQGLGRSRTDGQGKKQSNLGAVAQRPERAAGPNARRVLGRRLGQGLGGETVRRLLIGPGE